MTTTPQIPDALLSALPAGVAITDCEMTTFAALRAAHDDVDAPVLADIDDDALVVVLPGWTAADGNAVEDYPDAESGAEAAQEYVAAGDWGSETFTEWVRVRVWRTAVTLDTDGDPVRLRVDTEHHTITVEPDEPDCADDEAHEWCSPHSVLGGCTENPGVQGHGGGVIITEICRHCGTYRVTDTWDHDPSTWEQGLTSVEYREGDEASFTYVLRRRLQALWDTLSDSQQDAFDRAVIRKLGLPNGYGWTDIVAHRIDSAPQSLDDVERLFELIREESGRHAGIGGTRD